MGLLRTQSALGFDLEPIRLRPSALGRTGRVETHHRPLQNSALEPETHVVKVHACIELGKLAKHPKHRDRLCSSPTADQIGDIVATEPFVVVYVAADNDDPLA